MSRERRKVALLVVSLLARRWQPALPASFRARLIERISVVPSQRLVRWLVFNAPSCENVAAFPIVRLSRRLDSEAEQSGCGPIGRPLPFVCCRDESGYFHSFPISPVGTNGNEADPGETSQGGVWTLKAVGILSFMTLLLTPSPLRRVKMTAAPYNYSYIFKYIIIGEWSALIGHARRTVVVDTSWPCLFDDVGMRMWPCLCEKRVFTLIRVGFQLLTSDRSGWLSPTPSRQLTSRKWVHLRGVFFASRLRRKPQHYTAHQFEHYMSNDLKVCCQIHFWIAFGHGVWMTTVFMRPVHKGGLRRKRLLYHRMSFF